MSLPIHRHKWRIDSDSLDDDIQVISTVTNSPITSEMDCSVEEEVTTLCQLHNKLVEEYNELQGKGVPNLDDADNEELEAFLKVPTSLTQYAWHVKLSRVHREKGNVGEAERYEKINEGIYNNLPDWAKW